jgi:hydroxyethylthiazole kinase-like uncharacterized protein yjeF
MEPILTRAQSRQLDARVIAAGVSSIILMENAGRGAADIIGRDWPSARLLVVCGPGNNGGDGLVVARRWLVWGRPVRVWLTTRTLSPDAQIQLEAYQASGGQVAEGARFADELAFADVLVDALFGTGLSRPVDGAVLSLIEAMNGSGKPIVALDIPSGLDCDRGTALGLSVRARTTICFGALKRATATSSGRQVCGSVEVVDIGVPLPVGGLLDAVAWAPSDADACDKLASRAAVGHKGEAGHVLVVGGALGTTGAAALAARGAFRAGAGLVTIATHPEVARVLETQLPEVMKVVLGPATVGVEQLERALVRATTVVIGPGLGLSSDSELWVEHVVNRFAGTVVVDADAISLCCRLTSWSRRGNLVFTPHPGEAARLLNTTASVIEGDRYAAIDQLVQRSGNVVVLKGAPSLIGYEQHRHVNRLGAACMSTAGSGDVLSGIIAGLACQMGAFDAAWTGAWLHAAAGEAWASAHGRQRGMLASELADNVPSALARIEELRRVGRI